MRKEILVDIDRGEKTEFTVVTVKSPYHEPGTTREVAYYEDELTKSGVPDKRKYGKSIGVLFFRPLPGCKTEVHNFSVGLAPVDPVVEEKADQLRAKILALGWELDDTRIELYALYHKHFPRT